MDLAESIPDRNSVMFTVSDCPETRMLGILLELTSVVYLIFNRYLIITASSAPVTNRKTFFGKYVTLSL